MSITNKILRRICHFLGYEIIKKNDERICPFGNFQNLTKAYEHLLKSKNIVDIPDDQVRSRLMARLLGTPPSEAYSIVQALTETQHLTGDVCEFGVAQGETSALIANEIKSGNRKLHLFDSFQGLPAPTEKDQLIHDIFSLGSMDKYKGTMSFPEKMVEKRLVSISFPTNRYAIHKGFIEKVLNEDDTLPQKVSFAYVDFDFYEPIKVTLKYLDKIVEKGAVIVVDDYNYFSSGAKTAVDEFVNESNAINNKFSLIIPDVTLGYFAILKRDF